MVEGQTLDLNCVVVGQPQATITWYKRGGSLPSRHQVRKGTVEWGDQGCFPCPVHASKSSQQASLTGKVLALCEGFLLSPRQTSCAVFLALRG